MKYREGLQLLRYMNLVAVIFKFTSSVTFALPTDKHSRENKQRQKQ